MTPKVPMRTPAATSGNGGARAAQEHEHRQHHERDRDQQRPLDVAQRARIRRVRSKHIERMLAGMVARSRGSSRSRNAIHPLIVCLAPAGGKG